jgi:uncharacterized FAD-dependent dehydrogenase
VTGVRLQDGSEIQAAAVVLAVGHSARPLFHNLVDLGASVTPKPFAMGFRIEHPQELINRVQLGEEVAEQVGRGEGKVPVADYRLAAEVPLSGSSSSSSSAMSDRDKAMQDLAAADGRWGERMGAAPYRSVYSFCMCPGGQIVPTSCAEGELCINGMSFSRRNSKWANSAVVVGIVERDWAHLVDQHGVLAGVALQQEIEKRAFEMGGGGFRAPAQRAPDFLAGRASRGPLPSSSYRLGVTAARCDELYSAEVTEALRAALRRWDRQMPGFAGNDALLHGVETRTSSPVRVDRDEANYLMSRGLAGLYPCGEGAGYAGGIVSAAVDGLRVGLAVSAALTGRELPGAGKRGPSAASLTY